MKNSPDKKNKLTAEDEHVQPLIYQYVDERKLLFLVLLVSFAIFLLDIIMPIRFAVWVFYMIPLLMTWRSSVKGTSYIAASIITVATYGAFFADPFWMPRYITLANRTASIIAVWIVAVILNKYQVARELARLSEELEEAKNIAERRAREAEEGKSILNAIMEFAPEQIQIASSDHTIIYDTRFSTKMTGYSMDELTGITIEERFEKMPYYHPDNTKALPKENPFLRALDKGEIILKEEWKIRTAKGELVISVNAGPLKDRSGNITGAISTWRDITDRVKAEEALSESEERFRILAESADAFIVIIKDSNFIYANRFTSRISGYSIEELYEMEASGLIHPGDAEIIMGNLRKCIEGGDDEPGHYEFRILTKGGEVRWLDFSAVMVTMQGEKVIIGIGIDSTDRIQAEQALKTSEAQFRGFFENMAVGAVEVNLNARFVRVNDFFCDLTGYSREELLSMGPLDLDHPDEIPEDRIYIEDFLQGRVGNYNREKRYIRKDGKVIWVHITSSLIKDANGVPLQAASIVENITERKKYADRLEKSESRFRAAVDYFPGVFLVYDPDRVIKFVNREGLRKSGVKRDEIIGHRDADVYPSAAIETYESYFINAIETKQTQEFEAHIVLADREYFTMMSIVPLCDEEDRIWQILHISYDITERRKAEAALKASEEKYRTLFESMDEGFCIVEMIFGQDNKAVDYLFLEVNPAFEKHVGLKDVVGKKMSEIVPSYDSYWYEIFGDVASTQKSIRFTKEVEQLGIWFEVYAFPIGTPEDRQVAMIFSNITERLRVEQALKQSEATYRGLFENITEGVHYWKIITDENGRIETWVLLDANPSALEAWGMELENIKGKKFEEIFGTETREHYMPVIRRIMERNSICSFEEYFPAADRYFRFSNIPIRDCFFVTAVDITEIKKSQKIAEQKTAEVETANKELETFSYSVSHDLRAPLRIIDGFSQLLVEEYRYELKDEPKDYIYRIRRAVNNMEKLIDGLLTLSRTTRRELNYVTFDMSSKADSIMEEFTSLEPERKVEIYISQGMIVEGDSTLLEQVLKNLLGNAWKFTSKRDVPKIEFSEKFEHGKRIFYVRDNGAGFDMKYADNLFIPFRRLHAEKEFSGDGIGLSIVYRIIKRHGGDIWAESTPDEGTTFYFTIL